MKKLMLAMALVTAVVIGAKAQVLYRISGNGLDKESYVIGTHHLAPVSFADSIAGLKEAFAETTQVYGEIDMADMMKPEKLMEMQKAMMLGDGKTLTTLLDEGQQAKLNIVLRNLMGADLTNPMVKSQLDALTPKALLMQLTMIMNLKSNPNFDISNSFDGYFQKLAQQEGKPVKGFETMEFQTETLYKGSTMERQTEQLICFCDNYDYMQNVTERLTKAYFAQDLKEIKNLVEEKLNTACDATEEENNRLIYDRNRNWLAMMPLIMRQTPTFFAVGAAHLVGDKGVLAGLRKAGYTVESVK
ncbi:TraB/GumN family protein [Prevotella sp. OH937_COT-195]|uniref:TraB/GumN family protein n=1 Tax=Prevotella sp. OH937_COT-195 TaxID=2491051 RepID=UPI000F64A908|nr:TraB/GumN family protein [Prevotella sp. OH937_COT-195]RRC99848.1 TraB/GumN family protein [Prevotella sp. OH937_COT-195]